jgi:hypothetical protein
LGPRRLDDLIGRFGLALLGTTQGTPSVANHISRGIHDKVICASVTAGAAQVPTVDWKSQEAPPASVAQYLAESEPQHNSMLRTSVVPTVLKAGVGVNVIPSEAEATDCRGHS